MATAVTAPTTRLQPWRLTVDRYGRMIEAGILSEKDRVYLWKGQLVAKMTKGRPRTVTVLRLTDALKRVVPDGWYVEPEQAMVLDDASMPEPDLKVVRGRMEDYTRPPSARDVPLVIEVADSTLADDRGEILEAYAAEAIPSYWIANIPDRQIEVYPGLTGAGSPARYASRAVYRPGDEVDIVLDGRIAVAEVFPGNPAP
jgi:hypothetical protein